MLLYRGFLYVHESLCMINEMGPNIEDNFDPTLDFVRRRMNASRPTDRKLIAGLLQGEGGLGHAFSSLVEKLSDSRKRYTLEQLKQRDSEAENHAATYTHVPQEDAGKSTMLRREDEGIPSALELFLITLLSDKEWIQLCKTREKPTHLGELPARNVIESVLADEPRTKKFIHAVQSDVRQFRESASTIYDAGCGPFPMLGLSAALASPRAQVICLELNPLSARIAQAIVDKFVADSSIAPGQVIIKEGDALSQPLPPEGSIDLFISETLGAGLLDEQGPAIFSRYAKSINQERGSTIPYRAKLSAALVPVNKGVLHTREGIRVEKYQFVINANGAELPILPAQEWKQLEGGRELPLTHIPDQIEGTIDLPRLLNISAFDMNYGVQVCTEFVIDRQGLQVLTRYETFITSPMPLGMGVVTVPDELKEAKPASLLIKFSFVPGSDSRKASKVEVVRKDEAR